MYLSLLEFIYATKDCDVIETWFGRADLEGVLISTMQYDEEILAVLASERRLIDTLQKMYRQPAISSCEEKHAAVYRVTTTVAPELVFRSFPFGAGEEWYHGPERTAYLCLRSHHLNGGQITWVATCTQIVTWDALSVLSPVPICGKIY